MTKAEIVAALNALTDNGWNINLRGVRQDQDSGLVWIAKAMNASSIVDASGDTFEACAEQLVKKLVP
jgi:hypothetical protein